MVFKSIYCGAFISIIMLSFSTTASGDLLKIEAGGTFTIDYPLSSIRTDDDIANNPDLVDSHTVYTDVVRDVQSWSMTLVVDDTYAGSYSGRQYMGMYDATIVLDIGVGETVTIHSIEAMTDCRPIGIFGGTCGTISNDYLKDSLEITWSLGFIPTFDNDNVLSGFDPTYDPLARLTLTFYSAMGYYVSGPTYGDQYPFSQLYFGQLIADSSYATVTRIPSLVPIPSAVWLFGSGLVGLIGVARRKKA